MNSRKVDLARHRLPSPGRLAELVLESSADFAVLTICLDGTITSWNSAAERVMGWSEDEAVGQEACMIFTPEDQVADTCGQEMARARSSGRAADERWHIRKDGTRFWGSGSMTRLEDDETGEYIGYAKIVRDRTEQHLAGERLRASEAVLRGVFENSADCLKLLTLDGCLTLMNGPGLAMLGFGGLEEVRGRDYAALWPEEEREKVKRALAEAAAGRVGRFHGRGPADTPRWWDVQVTPVPGEDGRPELLVASSRDVTERERSREALRVSEARLRAALGISTVGVMFWGPDFALTEANNAFLHMTGFSHDEVIGRTWQDLTPTEFHAPSLRAVEELATAGETTPYEKQYYRKDGSRWWGLFAARQIGDEVVEFVLDVTDRREAEAALRASEERLRALVSASAEVMYFMSPDWTEMCQLSGGDFLADTGSANRTWIEDYIHPDDRPRVTAAIQEAIRTKGVFELEHRVRRADGGLGWTLSRAVPLLGPAGETREWFGVARDMTARRETEEALRTSEERLRLIVENVQDYAIFTTDPDDVIDTWLPGAANVFGWSSEEAVGRPAAMTFTPEDCAAGVPEAELETARSQGAAPNVRWHLRKDSSRVFIEGSTTALCGSDGVIQGFLKVGQDVTARRAAEERQALLAREVDHRAKNVLAVVQAALRLTPKEDAEAYARAVEGRVGALARAQTLLAEERWNGAGLHALLRGELAPFLGGTARAELDGPPVVLPAGTAQPLAMAMHELATNAVKHGALSVPGGRVSVSWRLEREPGGPPLLRLRWIEGGGPPVASIPARRGFGTRVLDGTVRGQLGGKVSLVWEASGLICGMDVPLKPERGPAHASAAAAD